jgi:hypothetical protein
MNITFKEVTERTKKATLMRHFTKAYFGEVIKLEEAIFARSSKFICAYDGPNELGFVRIVYYGKTEIDKKCSAIWGAADGYVRHEYRGMNVLKNLLIHVIQNYDVCMILIKEATYKENLAYYKSLGFSSVIAHESDEELVRVSLKKFAHIINKHEFFSLPKKLMNMDTSGSIKALTNRSLGP